MKPAGSAGDARAVPVLLMAVMLAWGFNIPAVKALTGVMDVAWVGLIRLLGSALVLTACLLLRDRRLPRLSSGEWLKLGAIAFLSIYLNQLLFVLGMRLTPATTASLVMALNPLLALLAGAMVFKERIGARRAFGVAVGFAGVALVALMAPSAGVELPGLGELSLVGGLVVFIGGGLLIQHIVRNLDALVVGWAIYLAGSAMLGAHAVVSGGWDRTVAAFQLDWVWWCALYSGVLGTALSNVAWFHTIARVGQSRASPYLYWLAIFGLVSSAVTLHEPIGWWHALGLVLVVVGVRMGSTPAQRL